MLARQLVRHKERIDQYERDLRDRHFTRLNEGLVQAHETSAIHLDLLTHLKRINSHVSHVAYAILQQPRQPRRLRDPPGHEAGDAPHPHRCRRVGWSGVMALTGKRCDQRAAGVSLDAIRRYTTRPPSSTPTTISSRQVSRSISVAARSAAWSIVADDALLTSAITPSSLPSLRSSTSPRSSAVSALASSAALV
ncbi:MAG: hypothetical protein ACYSW1_07345 [Planctomycetota bacterium]